MSIVPQSKYKILEEQADELLKEWSKKQSQHAVKREIISSWRSKVISRRELLTGSGSVEPHVRQGTYGRIYNPRQPWLNSREGIAGYYYPKPRPLGIYTSERQPNGTSAPGGRAACSVPHRWGEKCVDNCQRSRGRS